MKRVFEHYPMTCKEKAIRDCRYMLNRTCREARLRSIYNEEDSSLEERNAVICTVWKALDTLQTSEQTLCLLVLYKSSLWSALPQEIKQMVRQYTACKNRSRTGLNTVGPFDTVPLPHNGRGTGEHGLTD